MNRLWNCGSAEKFLSIQSVLAEGNVRIMRNDNPCVEARVKLCDALAMRPSEHKFANSKDVIASHDSSLERLLRESILIELNTE
jgi:hypothetical protein